MVATISIYASFRIPILTNIKPTQIINIFNSFIEEVLACESADRR